MQCGVQAVIVGDDFAQRPAREQFQGCILAREYLANFTNAAFIVKDGFKLPENGLYSGFDENTHIYDKATWNYKARPTLGANFKSLESHKYLSRLSGLKRVLSIFAITRVSIFSNVRRNSDQLLSLYC